MSRHDLVPAQTSNVCITHHAALNAIAYIVWVKQFVTYERTYAFSTMSRHSGAETKM